MTSDNSKIYEAVDFINSVLAKGEKWTDPEFKPDKKSFCKPFELEWEKAKDLAEDFKDDVWMRASDICKERKVLPGIFKDGPVVNDIDQGSIGTCYFLSPLASLTEFPELVKSRFITKRVNKCGIYAMTFFINGEETPVIVDDHFMVDELDNPYTLGADIVNGKMWVPLMEKAWFKLCGSYVRAHGGYSDWTMAILTGLPVYSILHDQETFNADECFERIRLCDYKNYAMMAGTKEDWDNGEDKKNGLLNGHCYTLIGAHKFEHEGSPVCLVKLRNPWGHGEWDGEWSDGSSVWTEELKQ
jgi:calpain-15